MYTGKKEPTVKNQATCGGGETDGRKARSEDPATMRKGIQKKSRETLYQSV